MKADVNSWRNEPCQGFHVEAPIADGSSSVRTSMFMSVLQSIRRWLRLGLQNMPPGGGRSLPRRCLQIWPPDALNTLDVSGPTQLKLAHRRARDRIRSVVPGRIASSRKKITKLLLSQSESIT